VWNKQTIREIEAKYPRVGVRADYMTKEIAAKPDCLAGHQVSDEFLCPKYYSCGDDIMQTDACAGNGYVQDRYRELDHHRVTPRITFLNIEWKCQLYGYICKKYVK
jgi:hypothetical protein